MASLEERLARKTQMQTSNWSAASKYGKHEYNPVSSTPLDPGYQRSTSTTKSDFFFKMQLSNSGPPQQKLPPASDFIARRYAVPARKDAGTFGASIVLGSDPAHIETSNSSYGMAQHIEAPPIDLLETVPVLRDSTLDGAHRASMTERHFLQIHDPYASKYPGRAASFQSGQMLRENKKRNVRSQYNPEDMYLLPPSVQSEIGWGITSKYKDACAKFQDGAAWHGRTGSHITKFSERLLLGARHHLSGPMTNPKLHY
ncbi:hypothetical protein AB1Y20_022695 [Prymnesium parvum]|uniref:Uncharacterized protein n=1 Tax=Prymnesium parvum TaxID=97485 RepID=A0AB34JIC1_PRYPA